MRKQREREETANGGIGTTGDSSGNIGWGFNPEDMVLFPEIEVNNDVSFWFSFSGQLRMIY